MKEEIFEIIRKLIQSDIDKIDENDNLLEMGVLDSIIMLEMLDEIESRYGIEIDGEDIVPENFKSVIAITNTVSKYLR